jgi:hypothetical protein
MLFAPVTSKWNEVFLGYQLFEKWKSVFYVLAGHEEAFTARSSVSMGFSTSVKLHFFFFECRKETKNPM